MSKPGFPSKPIRSSPISKPKPMRIKVTVPMQKSIRFFMMMLPVFLARVKPASTMAKPACIQNTSAAPIKNHTANSCSFVICVTSSLIVSFMLNHSINFFTAQRHVPFRKRAVALSYVSLSDDSKIKAESNILSHRLIPPFRTVAAISAASKG